jgi:hypothetical protein
MKSSIGPTLNGGVRLKYHKVLKQFEMMNHIFWNTEKRWALFWHDNLSFPIMGQRPIEVINFTTLPREFTAYFNNPQAYSITAINHTEQKLPFILEKSGYFNGI